MSVELDEVRRFLAAHEPFAHLPTAELDALPAAMTVSYVRRGTTIIAAGAACSQMFVVRSGAVDVLDADGVLLDRRGTGDSVGYSTVVPAPGNPPGTARYTMVAVEDSLLLTLPGADLLGLVDRCPEVARYYAGLSVRIRADADRLRQRAGADILRIRVADLLPDAPEGVLRTAVTTGADATVAAAARLMVTEGVSCLPVTGDGRLTGILTDRDLRSRVVAADLPGTTGVGEVMTADPVAADPDATVFEAMLQMSDLGIHHLPVVAEDGRVIAVLAAADIMRRLRTDPIYLAADLARATEPAQLRRIVDDTAEMASGFIERGASPDEIAGLLTVGLDALARRLLTLAEEELGAPPVPYAFVVVGSQGRRAVGFASDQDNALVLDDSYDRDAHGAYFADLSQRVCDGLHAAGQVHCPGDMMASNPAWRMTVSQWRETFHTWVTAPDPDALLHAQTFFDMRVIHGVRDLVDGDHGVHRYAVAVAKDAPRLHAQLAAIAARREPPLGVFRGLAVDRGGDYAHTLHIKAGGTAAIVQIARLYSLVAGSTVVGTRARLAAAAEAGVLSGQGARDLTDAFDALTAVTLRHQAARLRRGETPDYHIDPDTLGRMDRENLRDAFGIVKSAQSGLAVAYPVRST
jgi:CBS domain-containing protein